VRFFDRPFGFIDLGDLLGALGAILETRRRHRDSKIRRKRGGKVHEAILGSLGASRERSWRLSGRSRGGLESLECLFGPLGAFLGSLGDLLGASWGPLGCSLGLLRGVLGSPRGLSGSFGSSWELWEPLGDLLGAPWGLSGASWGLRGGFREALGAPGSSPGASLTARGASRRRSKNEKKQKLAKQNSQNGKMKKVKKQQFGVTF